MPHGTQAGGMTDRRDTDEELATLLAELETTLTELHRALDEADVQSGEGDRERSSPGPSPPFRPPGLREILRFTEQQTIPTLIAILEVNIRLLRLAGATLRAVDPERSAVETADRSTAARALDAGGRLSTDRLTAGLSELQDALSGTDAPNPEARRLLDDAETLSAEVRERLRDGTAGSRTGSGEDGTDGGVSIEVEDASVGADDDEDGPAAEEGEETDGDSGVDVDAELDSIREEVRDDGKDDSVDEGGAVADDDSDDENESA